MAADLFGISQATVSRIYRAMLPLIEQVTCPHRRPLPEALRGQVVLVDPTLPIGNRRTDPATHLANFSGKRPKAGLSVQIVSDLDGHLLAVSEPLPGSTHDATAFVLTGLADLLADIPTIGDTAYPEDTIWNQLAVIDDHGYGATADTGHAFKRVGVRQHVAQ